MLLTCLSALALSTDSLDKKARVIVPRDGNDRIVTSRDVYIRLQQRSMPITEDEETVMHMIHLGNNEYLIKYSSGRYLCGKKEDSGVIGCESVHDGRTAWRVEMRGNGDTKLSIGDDCLVYTEYDRRERTNGNYLNMKRCRNDDTDYLWRIRSVDYTVNESDSRDVDVVRPVSVMHGTLPVEVVDHRHVDDQPLPTKVKVVDEPLPTKVKVIDHRHVDDQPLPTKVKVIDHRHVSTDEPLLPVKVVDHRHVPDDHLINHQLLHDYKYCPCSDDVL